MLRHLTIAAFSDFFVNIIDFPSCVFPLTFSRPITQAAERAKKPKEFDPTQSSGVALLSEMSLVELHERVQVRRQDKFLFEIFCVCNPPVAHASVENFFRT